VAIVERAFLEGIGFRRAGTRLIAPVTRQKGERALTVLRLVATRDATDLVYELTDLPGDQGAFPTPQRGDRDHVALRVGAHEYGEGGGMSISVRAGKLVRSFTMVPLPEHTTALVLHISGPSIGDWDVPLELEPFPAPGDAAYQPIGATTSAHGVTVTLRGMVETQDATALDLQALHEADKVTVTGLGGLRMRDESTALILRDEFGRTFIERFRNDARDQFPDPTGIGDVAIFDPLPDDASELVLEVPAVCFEDYRPTLDVELPIQDPIETRLGDYPIRLLASRETEVQRGGVLMRAVAIDLDLGTLDDPLCVIKPGGVKVDGKFAGMGFGSHGIRRPSPTPLKTIEIFPGEGPMPPRVTLFAATVRARGPWTIRFNRPR